MKLFIVILCLIISNQIMFGEKIFIVPILDSPCPEGRNDSTGSGYGFGDISESQRERLCLTLELFARQINASVGIVPLDQMLKLASGEHSLDSLLNLSNITTFTMISEGAIIMCSTQNASIQLCSIENIAVSGITFIGCGEINVSYVEQFTFENSSIRMSYLILYQISNATVTNSTFLCIQGDCNDTHPAESALVIERSFALIQNCLFTGLKGGAVLTHQSTITIDNCTFEKNVIDYYVTENKWSLFPRVVTITYSDIWLFHSRFVNNIGGALTIDSGIWSNMVLERRSICGNQIVMDHNVFEYNHHEYYGTAVGLYITNSTVVSISDCNFSSNTFYALYISLEGADYYNLTAQNNSITCMFSSCTFTNNSRALNLQLSSTLSTVLIEWTNFTENIGAALSVFIDSYDSCSLSIYESHFISNQVFVLSEGLPSIYLAAGSIMISNSYAYSNGGDSKAYNMSLTIDRSKFMNNVYLGDVFCIYGYLHPVTIDFYDWGVAKNQTCSILRTQFINNTAPCASALAAYTGNYSLSIIDSQFLNNSAKYCGALGLNVGGATIIRSIFSHNSTVSKGGSICTLPRGLARKLSISDSTLLCWI